MKRSGGKSEKGFTIIEVSLVLAIAGLIFLAVFLAVPALQRNAKDAERREDVATLLRKIKDYQTANRGALPTDTGTVMYNSTTTSPTSWIRFYKDFLGNDFTDPDGTNYELEIMECGDNTPGSSCGDIDPGEYTMVIVKSATCGSDNDAIKSSNIRKVAVIYKLEIGQNFCQNS